MKKKRIGLFLVMAAGTAAVAWIAHAGSLEPPAPPVPTDRFQISQACAVNTGCFPLDTPGYPVTIATSGSYRLTGNLQGVAQQNGIEIGANDATLDLYGFAVRGTPGSFSGLKGIGSTKNITVRNGMFLDWGLDGVGLGSAENVLVINVRDCP